MLIPIIVFGLIELIAVYLLLASTARANSLRDLVKEHGVVCAACLYPLRGIDATRCPECGAAGSSWSFARPPPEFRAYQLMCLCTVFLVAPATLFVFPFVAVQLRVDRNTHSFTLVASGQRSYELDVFMDGERFRVFESRSAGYGSLFERAEVTVRPALGPSASTTFPMVKSKTEEYRYDIPGETIKADVSRFLETHAAISPDQASEDAEELLERLSRGGGGAFARLDARYACHGSSGSSGSSGPGSEWFQFQAMLTALLAIWLLVRAVVRFMVRRAERAAA